jgi:hypothetical protein
MRISRPHFDDIPVEEGRTEVVAEHARSVSESFARWYGEAKETDADTTGIWESLVWMK